jgi:hypothetical protein
MAPNISDFTTLFSDSERKSKKKKTHTNIACQSSERALGYLVTLHQCKVQYLWPKPIRGHPMSDVWGWYTSNEKRVLVERVKYILVENQ